VIDTVPRDRTESTTNATASQTLMRDLGLELLILVSCIIASPIRVSSADAVR
jgi:hypothetical protein